MDRDRAIAAHATEVRAYQTFLAAVLLVLGTFHLLFLAPYLELRAALPTVSAATEAAERELLVAQRAERVAQEVSEALNTFRQELAAAPEQFFRGIGDLVARGRGAAEGDVYKSLIRVQKEGGQAGEEEQIAVEEAIRRDVGRRIEALAVAFELSLEPMRAARGASADFEQLVRTAQETVGRDILSLNEALREAFAADPNFWRKWGQQGAGLGAASTGADETVRRIDSGLRALSRGIANAQLQARTRQQEGLARIESLRANRQHLEERFAHTGDLVGIFLVDMSQSARLYPIVAGLMAVTLLFRLRRILNARRGLAATADLDLVAPSWIVGGASAPGRWWALVLVAAPYLAMLHAGAAAVADRRLFATVTGAQSLATTAGYLGAYAVLAIVGLVQLQAVARALLARPRPQQGRPAKK